MEVKRPCSHGANKYFCTIEQYEENSLSCCESRNSLGVIPAGAAPGGDQHSAALPHAAHFSSAGHSEGQRVGTLGYTVGLSACELGLYVAFM